MKKASAFLRTPLAKTFAVLAICLGFSLFGFSVAFGYGGGGGGSSSSFVPAVTAIDVPLVINGTQQGSISYNTGGDNSVQVTIPANSFTGSATFKVMGGSLTGADPIGGTGIEGGVNIIEATDANGNPINNFNNSLTVTFRGLALPADVSNIGVYFLDTATNQWVLVPGAIIDPASGTVTFTVNHFTKFAVLNVPGTPSTVKTSVTKVVTTVTPVTPVTTGQTSAYQVDSLTVKFRAGLTAKQMAGITNLVNSGRLFSATDAKNYAWAIGQKNWQQFVGTNPKIFKFTASIKYGSVGNEVRALQQKLKDLGYFVYPSITGYFGTVTKTSLINYQKAKGLPASGVMDTATRAELNNE